MTSKQEFEDAGEYLRHLSEQSSNDVWKLRNTILSHFDNLNAWTLLNELIQNAVDTEATTVKIELHSDGLEFRHNGKEPLDKGSVEGLCGFSMSTKGLDSVGFMGIGFKSFIRFFHKVTIYDKGIRFAIDINQKANGNPDLVDLYHPQWVENCEVVDGETVFRFSNPQGDAMETLRDDLGDIDSIRLAVLGMRGLERVSIDDDVYNIENIDNGVEIRLGVQTPRMFTILEEEVNMDGDAFRELIKVRNVDDAEGETETTRKVRLVKEFSLEPSEDDGEETSSIKPIKMDPGQAFCLVPLEGFSFPFKFGLDADWLLMPDRTKFHTDGKNWHRQILSVVPKLIRRYIQSLDKEMSITDWKESLNIFPDPESTPDSNLAYLDSDEFKNSMEHELAEVDFIRCIDGKFRNPTEPRDFPWNYRFGQPWFKSTYDNLMEECCKCPFLDRKAIEDATHTYLKEISENSLLDYPEKSEIDVEKVQLLWNPDKDKRIYPTILDIFANIQSTWGSEVEGIEITPLQNSKWARLVDGNLIFQSIPMKSGNSREKALYDVLEGEVPSTSSLIEVHDHLKRDYRRKDNRKLWVDDPGRKWKDSIEEVEGRAQIDLYQRIANLETTPGDVDLALAIFQFSLRADQPDLVKLIHTDSGVVSCNDCFIGGPYESNKEILQLVRGKTHSDEIHNIAKTLKKKIVEVREFLVKCGVRQFTPTLSQRTCDDADEASHFIGKSVSHASHPGTFRAPWSGERTSEGKEDAWTLCDYTWPIDFSNVDEIEALSKLLSDPPSNLSKAMKDPTIKHRKMTWFNRKKQEDPGRRNRPCQWLIDLRETAWVKCTNGEYRKPEDAPIGYEGDSTTVTAEIGEEIVKFYSKLNVTFGSDLKGMTLEHRIEYWKREKVVDPEFFIETLEESGIEGEELANVLLQSNFRTDKNFFAPLERFISNPSGSFGGYFGFAEDVPPPVRRLMEEKGIQFPDSITPPMLQSYINSFSNREKEAFRLNLKHIKNAYSELIARDRLDLSELKYRTNEDRFVEPGIDELYLQLTADSFRFKDLNEQLLDVRQFPSKIESLRRIYEGEGGISLIDNQIEFDDGGFFETLTVVNLTRVVMSMKSSDLIFEIKQCPDYSIKAEFDGKKLQLPYIAIDHGSTIQLYLTDDTKSWAQPIAEFMGSFLDAPLLIDNLNQALLFSDQDEFEDRYSLLCVDGKLDNTPYDVAEEIVLSNSEASGQPAEGSESERKTDRTPSIREPTTDASGEESDDGRDSSKPSTRKKKQGNNESKKLKVRKRKRSRSSQEIGDEGERLVEEHLKENGWNVTNRNEFYGKPVEGSDLIAERDGETRIIEVKATENDWTGSRSISWKQAVHALQYHDPEDKHGRGHVTCWLYVVERVFSEKPIIAPIDWCRQEPEFDFPIEWRESVSGEEE